jgi:pectin-derived oligosaccharide transport system substrate-binding protein
VECQEKVFLDIYRNRVYNHTYAGKKTFTCQLCKCGVVRALGSDKKKEEESMRGHRLFGVFMAALLVLSTGALFASSEPEVAAEGDAEIRFTWWGDTARHEKYNAIADLFENKNPGVTMIREFGGWSDYWDKLATQTAGGNAPDVQGMHLRYVANYAERGALRSLDEYVASGVIDLSNFPEGVKGAGQFNGQQLMVAQGYTVEGWAYNQAIFDRLGVPYPDFDWSWDDLRDTLEALRAADGSSDFFPGPDASAEDSMFNVFVKQRGKLMFTADGELGLDVADAAAWFEMWEGLRNDGLVPDGATTQEYDGVPLEQSLFVTGVTAVGPIPFNQLTLFQGAVPAGETLGLSRIPTMAGGKDGEELGASFLVIAATSDHPDVAAQFINHFVNDPAAVSIFKLEQGALGSTESNAVIAPLLNPIEQRLLAAIERAGDHIVPQPLPPAASNEVFTALTDAAQAVQFGQLSAQQAAEQFISRSRDILSN